MARPPRPEQLAALNHIRECMAEHGEEVGARMARADFPMIGKATWSRWCAQVRTEDALAAQSMPVGRAPPTPIAKSLLVAEVGEVPAGAVDFFEQVATMMSACDAIANYAWPHNPAAGARKLRNPLMLERATRLRAMVLDLAHRRDAEVFGIERTRALHRELLETLTGALGGDRSDVARKVVEALRALDARHRARERYIGLARQVAKEGEAA